jgi:2-amino-4-hydroxy-6-hydroxymethyldihydropteridine diphosphokinase
VNDLVSKMKYLISLGSNIGNGLKNLSDAISMLEEKSVSIDDCSSVYCSAPLDYVCQADFLNVSVLAETDLEPKQLLDTLKCIEKKMGRKKTFLKGPRKIDLDIIFWEKGVHQSDVLSIPHKEAMKRLFVIFPTLEIIENSPHFEEEKEKLQEILEVEKEQFVGQRIEKLCPFEIKENLK